MFNDRPWQRLVPGKPIVGAAAAALIAASACGASDDAGEADAMGAGQGGSIGSVPDSGGSAGSYDGGYDAGMGGSGGGAGGGEGVQFAATPAIGIIHASPDLFAFRLCAEVNGTYLNEYPYPFDTDHQLPESNFPGIGVGASIDLRPLVDELGDVSTVTLHALRADKLRVARATPEYEEEGCSDLLGPGIEPLPDDDFVTFEDVSLGNPDATPVRSLVITGCSPSAANLTSTQCGQDYAPATGNLSTQLIAFAPTLFTVPQAKMIYAVHVSPSLEALQPEHTLELTFSNLTTGSGRTSIASNVPVHEPTATPGEMTLPENLTGYGEQGFSLVAKKTAGDEQDLIEATLADVQRASAPYTTPEAFFTLAEGYLLVFVGDASAESEPWLTGDGSWNADYDGRGLHVVAVPFGFSQRR